MSEGDEEVSSLEKVLQEDFLASHSTLRFNSHLSKLIKGKIIT